MKFEQYRGATSTVEFAGKHFLIDPMFAPAFSYPQIPFTKNCAKGNPTVDVPLDPIKLLNYDALIVTHLHFDHFDEDAIRVLPKDRLTFVQSLTNKSVLEHYGFTNVTMLSEEGTKYGDIILYKTSCNHGSLDPMSNDFYQKVGLDNDAMGVVFKSPEESKVLYLVGDTVWYDKVEDNILKYKPDVIVVNAAGAEFPENHPIIMNVEDVEKICRFASSSTIVASHMDAVSHATVSRKDLQKLIEEKHITNLLIPSDGQVLSF